MSKEDTMNNELSSYKKVERDRLIDSADLSKPGAMIDLVDDMDNVLHLWVDIDLFVGEIHLPEYSCPPKRTDKCDCGAVLSRYNKGVLCAPCQRGIALGTTRKPYRPYASPANELNRRYAFLKMKRAQRFTPEERQQIREAKARVDLFNEGKTLGFNSVSDYKAFLRRTAEYAADPHDELVAAQEAQRLALVQEYREAREKASGAAPERPMVTPVSDNTNRIELVTELVLTAASKFSEVEGKCASCDKDCEPVLCMECTERIVQGVIERNGF